MQIRHQPISNGFILMCHPLHLSAPGKCLRISPDIIRPPPFQAAAYEFTSSLVENRQERRRRIIRTARPRIPREAEAGSGT